MSCDHWCCRGRSERLFVGKRRLFLADQARNSHLPRKSRSRRNGFSLMELMVVIVILGLLAGLVVVKTRSYLILSKQNAAKVEIAKMREALESYYAIYNHYPTNEEGINALVEPSEKLPEGLLSKVPKDPWGNPYVYNSPGKEDVYDIICYGADGREGGEGADADILDDNADQP